MDWLAIEILTGFQKLLCLGLERQPAAEVLQGTVATWVETLTTRLSWERERDAGRIRKAFVTMAGTRRSWPAPIDLIEAMPPPNEQNRIGRESSIPATAEQRARHLQNVLGEVAKPMTDRKSAAAGDS